MKYVILRTTLKLYLVYKQILDGKTGSESGSILPKITQLQSWGEENTSLNSSSHMFDASLDPGLGKKLHYRDSW